MPKVVKTTRKLTVFKKLASTSKHRKNCSTLLSSQKYPLHSRI